ncbi:hypothetical protein IC614_03015 [Allosphingosinicella flava]|uniref:Portal protein n=1 Tax=Allosphingosinicella flava TaxID=2771430 RepID=A0A7T2GKN3_9SPHN|nr:portal protein [Sphingosinicella flava]QPQ55587.1 hypothetical protein IC614_03015 [Sphingosinicella flava]
MAKDLADQETPARKTRAQRLAEVHERAMRRFDAIWAVEREERLQSLADRRFATIRGAMWEGQYAFGDGPIDENGDPIDSGFPKMEVPKFYRAYRRVLSEYRSSRKTVDFRPKGSSSDKRSADNLDGLYRADENGTPGGGQYAYANAFQEGSKGGRGGWRLRAVYEDESDEENDSQRIRLEPIYDYDIRAFFDLNDLSETKSESRYGFLLTPYTRDAFEAEWPDHDPSTFTGKLDWNFDWVTPEVVIVAEYYEVEDRSVLRRTFRNIATNEEITLDDGDLTEGAEGETREDELLSTGWEEVRARRIKRQRVHKYILSGAECLEDAGIIPGKYIPIIPYYADRCVVDGIERAQGVIRPVIDSTRLYNLMVSGLAEAAAGPASDTPIAAPEQMPGNIPTIWARRFVDRPSYLPLEPIRNAEGEVVQSGLSGSLPVAQVSPNMAALIQVAGADILDIMGESDRPEAVPSNTSAQAIELVNDEADLNDYLWRDQFANSLMWSGTVWLEMAKDLYVEEGREMDAIDDKGIKSKVKLSEPAIGPNGERYIKNDLTAGNYDVEVDVGPATKTKQDATVRAMLGISQTAVAAQKMDWASGALGVAILNMEGEGIDGYQNWVRQQGLREGWVEPSEEERLQLEEEAQNTATQPDPQAMLIQAATAQAEAEAMLAQSRTVETEAKAEQARAKTAEILAGIDEKKRDGILKAIELAMKGEGQRFEQMNTVMQNERSEVGDE